jgi:flagellin-like protein
MKRVWRKGAKEAVSPVIATILMVAITVVLAAVLYVMVSEYMRGDKAQPIGGSLVYLDHDSPSQGKATFTVILTDPSNPDLVDVSVKVLDPNQVAVAWNNGTDAGDSGAFYVNWTHLASEAGHIKGGDRLVITAKVPGDIGDYEVVVSHREYSNTVNAKVPS